MIEKIYKNKCMVTCDNCGIGKNMTTGLMQYTSCGGSEMNIRELQSALEYSREQLFQAEKRLDTATEPELIDAAIYEQKAWESRCSYYWRKLKEAVKSGQAIQRNWLVYFGDRC